MVELRNPAQNGDQITYDARLLKGHLPEAGGESSLFIDIIGIPMTPMSYGGAARRAVWR